LDIVNHGIEETEILCFFTNVPCPRLQKKVKRASTKAKVTLVYWKRPSPSYSVNLQGHARSIPIEASFINNKGFCRIIAFLIFVVKALRVLRLVRHSKKIYVDYFDTLMCSCILFWNSEVEIIYEVGDLISLQYGGKPFVNNMFSRIERILLKRVSLLIIPSPFFWSEYYNRIYKGRWILIENLPESKTWIDFHRKERNSEYVIGFIGSIRYRKPLECLLMAVMELRDLGFNVKVFFAGSGPEEQDIRRVACGLSFVSFYGPYEYDKDIATLYANVDIIFSVYDVSVKNVKIALPNRFYESIICRLPIITAKKTCLEHYVKQFNSGYSVDCYDVDEYKKVIISQLIFDSVAINITESLVRIDKSCFFYDKYYIRLDKIFSC